MSPPTVRFRGISRSALGGRPSPSSEEKRSFRRNLRAIAGLGIHTFERQRGRRHSASALHGLGSTARPAAISRSQHGLVHREAIPRMVLLFGATTFKSLCTTLAPILNCRRVRWRHSRPFRMWRLWAHVRRLHWCDRWTLLCRRRRGDRPSHWLHWRHHLFEPKRRRLTSLLKKTTSVACLDCVTLCISVRLQSSNADIACPRWPTGPADPVQVSPYTESL